MDSLMRGVSVTGKVDVLRCGVTSEPPKAVLSEIASD